MGRGSIQAGAKATARAVLFACAALAGACAPVVKTSSYTFDLYQLDNPPKEEAVLVDLYELFVGDEQIVYRDQEIPARLEEVRVVAIDGKTVPDGAAYGALTPGRHLFKVTIKTTLHEVAGQSLSLTSKPEGRILQTSEILSRRRFALRLKPGSEVQFDREGRPRITALASGLFGPEGTCQREGDDNRLCNRCQRDGGTARCVRERHYNYY